MMNFTKPPKRLSGKKLALLALAIGVALQGSVSYALEPVKIGRPTKEGVDTRLISEDSETLKKGIKDSAGKPLEPDHNIISIGNDSNLNISSSIAFGHSAKSLGLAGRDWGNTAVGIDAVANTMSAEAANKDTELFGHATALGYQSKATGHSSTALGALAKAADESTIAIGVNSKASGYRSLAVGDCAETAEKNSMAIGYGSTASSMGSIAIGTKASVLGRGAIAVGHGATIKNDPSGIVIGNHALIDNLKSKDPGNNIAMGVTVIENGKGNVAINGRIQSIVNDGSGESPKDSVGNIVIGNAYTSAKPTRSNGQANVVIGESASNNGHNNLVIGRGARAISTDALAIGELAKVSADESGAIGFNAEAREFGAYAIGQNAIASNFNSVALGGNSETGRIHAEDTAKFLNLAGQDYKFAGLASNDSGTLSIGKAGSERQIQNVAAGDITEFSTDAVNGSQLHAANTAINGLAKTLGDSHMLYTGDMGAVAKVKLNNNVKLVGGVTNEKLLSDNNIGVVASQDGDHAKLNIKLAKNLWGMESVTFGGFKTQNPVSLSSEGLSNGGKKITNVGNGDVSETSTDAVNGRQLHKAIVNNGAKVESGDNTTVTSSTNQDGPTTYKVDVKDNVTFGKDDKAINVNGKEGKVTVGKGEKSVTFDGTKAGIKAGKVTVDGIKGIVTAGKLALNGANGTVTGLTNKTWDEKKVVTGQAATEDQLKTVSEKLGNVAKKAGQRTSVSVNKATGKGPLLLKVENNKDGSSNYDVSLDLNIKGDVNDTSKLSDGNVGVVKEGESNYTVKLAKDLKGLNSVSANTVSANTVTATTVSGDTIKVGDNVTISRDGIDAGRTKVTNIHAGELSANSTDAVNGSQLHAANTAINGLATKLDDSHMLYAGDMGAVAKVKLNNNVKLVGGVTDEKLLSDNNIGVVASQDGDHAKLNIKLAKNLWGMESVTFGGFKTQNPVNLSSEGLSNGGKKITNVGNGEVSETSTDAVNGRQLYNAIVQNGAKVESGNNTMVTPSTNPDGSTTYKVDVNDNVTFGKDDKAIDVNGKEGKVAVGKGEKSVTVDGTKAEIKAGKVTVDGAKGNVTAGKVALDGEKGNVTAGRVALDGEKGTVTGLANRTWDEKNVVPGQAATEDQLKAVSEKLGDVEQKAGQHTSVSVNKGNGKGPLVLKVGTNNDGSANYDVSLDLNIKGDVSDTSKLSDGNVGVVKEGESNYTVKLAKDLKGLNSVSANTVSATTVTANTVTATTVSGDTIKAGDTVTISRDGIDAGSTKVTNILAGELSANSTDAVNGAQLYETNQAVGKNADDINKLGQAHSALNTRVNKVGAGAAALAALHPLDFDPNDKWNIATGTGSYRGQHALALGAFYRPDEDTMFNIASELGNGNNMWSVGVSFKFGRDKNNPAGRAHMAKEIVRLRAVNDTMQGEHQSMKAELGELKVKLEQLMKEK